MARNLMAAARGRKPTDERNTNAEHTTKIEEATERAAGAIRRAAARAAAERARARARTSAVASIGLVLGVVAALLVATGALAGLGVVVGVVAALVALRGLTATGHHYPYLAGRTEAIAGLLLAIGAVVVGILALSDVMSTFSTDTNQVERLRDWLPSWLT